MIDHLPGLQNPTSIQKYLIETLLSSRKWKLRCVVVLVDYECEVQQIFQFLTVENLTDLPHVHVASLNFQKVSCKQF